MPSLHYDNTDGITVISWKKDDAEIDQLLNDFDRVRNFRQDMLNQHKAFF